MLEDFKVITFYQFINLEDVGKLAQKLKCFCTSNKIRGSVILASEGINGTLSGLRLPIKQFVKNIYSRRFNNLELKYSYYKYMPFNRLKIKIKKEIITFSQINLNVEKNTATYVKPKDWNKLISKKNTLILDVRNKFEHEVGTFQNSRYWFFPKKNLALLYLN